MKKRIICLIIICILIFSVTGCGKSTNTIEKTSNKNGDDLSKYENLSDEEKYGLWQMKMIFMINVFLFEIPSC